MNLKKWTLLSEMIGALAVVVTLIVLVLEVRENTAAIRASAILEVNRIARDHLITMWTDAEANRIDQIGSENLAALNPEEQQRYFWNVRSFWLGMQTIYRQYELGTLPEEEWQVYYDVICTNISWPGTRELWDETTYDGIQRTRSLIPEFVAIVESCPTF